MTLSEDQHQELKCQLYSSVLLRSGARLALSRNLVGMLRKLELFKQGFDTCLAEVLPSFAAVRCFILGVFRHTHHHYAPDLEAFSEDPYH